MLWAKLNDDYIRKQQSDLILKWLIDWV
jgi:hypothetical protein